MAGSILLTIGASSKLLEPWREGMRAASKVCEFVE